MGRALLALCVSTMTLPVSASSAGLPACPLGESMPLLLAGDNVTACVHEVPLLGSDAEILLFAGGVPGAVSQEGIRTLAGYVLGDTDSFVRLVEGPGYFAGVAQDSSGWYWIHPDGTVRTQPLSLVHAPWPTPEGTAGAGNPLLGRLLVVTDGDFVADWGDTWHLYAITILNVVDGAYRAQLGFGLELAGVWGNTDFPPDTIENNLDFPYVQLLSGTDDPNLGFYGWGSIGAGFGISWVRTSPHPARIVNCGGTIVEPSDFEGTLYGAVMVSFHEIGHNQGQLHDPLGYYCAPTYSTLPYCTAYGGWRGEEMNCLEITHFYRPLVAAGNVAGVGITLAGKAVDAIPPLSDGHVD